LQGLLGGTFAASNAFLASFVCGKRLATLLSVMQGSARTALFVGPAIIGLLSDDLNLLHIFFYLAIFPALTGLVLFLLPAYNSISSEHRADSEASHQRAPVAIIKTSSLYRFQALFTIGTVLTYPYFVIDLTQRLELSEIW
jgi:MFS family permease